MFKRRIGLIKQKVKTQLWFFFLMNNTDFIKRFFYDITLGGNSIIECVGFTIEIRRFNE
jgi:hypothetical protein